MSIPVSELKSIPPAIANTPAAMRLVCEAIEMRVRFEQSVQAFVDRFGFRPRLPASYFMERAEQLGLPA